MVLGNLRFSVRVAEEGEELSVNDFGVGPGDRVWPKCDLQYPASLDKLRDAVCRGGDGENAISNTVNHESGSRTFAKISNDSMYPLS